MGHFFSKRGNLQHWGRTYLWLMLCHAGFTVLLAECRPEFLHPPGVRPPAFILFLADSFLLVGDACQWPLFHLVSFHTMWFVGSKYLFSLILGTGPAILMLHPVLAFALIGLNSALVAAMLCGVGFGFRVLKGKLRARFQHRPPRMALKES